MSVESNPRMHWFCFTSLMWLVKKKLALRFQPIRCKTNTSHDFVARVFPRFRRFGCFYFEFSLALSVIFLSSDWPLWLLWFWFYDAQSKSALWGEISREQFWIDYRRQSWRIMVSFYFSLWSWSKKKFCCCKRSDARLKQNATTLSTFTRVPVTLPVFTLRSQ